MSLSGVDYQTDFTKVTYREEIKDRNGQTQEFFCTMLAGQLKMQYLKVKDQIVQCEK